MHTTETPRRSNDRRYRLVAVAVAVIAAVAAYLAYSGDPDVAETAAPSGPVDRQITVSIVNKKITPPTDRIDVARGAMIRITVTSDVADEMHVHGYDRKAELVPGVPASVQFRADTTGLFEVETHGTGLVLFQLLIR